MKRLFAICLAAVLALFLGLVYRLSRQGIPADSVAPQSTVAAGLPRVTGQRPQPAQLAPRAPSAAKPVPVAALPTSHPAWPGAKVLQQSELPPLNGLTTRLTLVQSPDFPYPICIEDQLNSLGLPDEKRLVRRFEAVASHLLVKLQPNQTLDQLAAIARQLGAQPRPHPTAPSLYYLDLSEVTVDGVTRARLLLAQYPEVVAYAEPDPIVRAAATMPNDPSFGNQWGLHNTGQDGGTADVDMDAPEGWDTRRDAGDVVVAVVDSGIRYTHEDLAGNMWRNPREIAGNGVDDDGNGFVDDVHGINALAGNSEPLDDLPDADLGVGGHGTSVAGVIGAVANNGKGTAGVAWKVQLMALKWFNNQGAGALSDAIKCLDYARVNGAAIVNASWQQGGLLSTMVDQSMMDALERLRQAGVIFVASAGNDGVNNDLVAHYPSNYPFDNMIAVGAGTREGSLWRKSNFGERLVDIVAPGEDVWCPTSKADDSYEALSGTSFAAPHVTGMLAILKAQFPQADYATLIQRVLSGAERRDRLVGKVRTGGFANLARALSLTRLVAFPEITGLTLNGEPVTELEVSVLQGTNVTLAVTATGGAPLAYSWKRDGRAINNATTGSYNIPAFASTDIGEYQVAVSNAAGVATATLRLLGVVQRPELAAAVNAPGRSFLCSGNTLWSSQNTVTRDGVSAGVSGRIAARQGTVAATTVTGPGKVSFAWSVSSERDNDTLDFLIDDVRVESISGEVAWVKREFELTAGQHNLRWSYVKDASLSKGADKGYLDLFEFTSDGKVAPTITLQPVSQTVLEGAAVFFSVVAAGSGPLSYQWTKDNTPIPGAQSNRLDLASVALTDEGRYAVTVRNDSGSVASAAARLTITPAALAPRFVTQPGDLTIDAGSTASLRASANGTQPLHFQWRLGGAPLPGQTNATLTLTNVAVASSGIYSVVVSNTAGLIASRDAKLTVTQVQLAPIITKQPADATLVQPERLELEVEVSGLGPFAYKWTRNGKVLPGETRPALVIAHPSHTDTGSYQVLVSSPFGSAASKPAFVRVTERSPSLEQAVENTAFTWCTGGDAPWFRQTDVTLDDEDALQSGPIEDSQFSQLIAVAVGPGQVSFHWKVSSEAQYDYLDFYVDDEFVDGISGEWDWEEAVWNLPEGTHVLSWVYSKDESDSDGDDAAWLDGVSFVSFSTESPVVVQHPQSASGYPGDTVVLEAKAVGSPLLSLQWFKGEVPLPGATDSSLTLTNLTLQDAGAYHLTVSNRFGLVQSRDASIFVFDQSSAVDAALNRPSLSWTNYGFASWYPQVETTADAISAMQTPTLADNGVAWLGSRVTGPAMLYFYWKVSSEEDYDFLEFLLDDEIYDYVSGEVDWRDTSVLIPPGVHDVDWVYLKDDTESEGADAAWVDYVEILPLDSRTYWRNVYFTPHELLDSRISGFTADPDSDGRNNLVEYAFGLNPLSPSDPGSVVTQLESGAPGTFFIINYNRRSEDPDLKYQIEVSSDLRNWTLTPASAWSETVTPAGELLEHVRARYLTPVATGKNRFFRIRVSAVEP